MKKFPSLKSYFLSERFSDGCFHRLNERFSDPLLEPAFSFTQATISVFTNFSLLLQCEEPTLHILKSSIQCIGRKIANRIVKPSFLKNITSVADIDLTEESILLDPKTIFLGGTTKATMNRLLNNGDITQATYDQFHKGVQVYYKDALDYIQRKFPISDPVICNSRWVDVLQRDKAEWNQVEFFIEKYSNQTFLQNIDNDLLFDEFIDYQSVRDDDISADAWAEANVVGRKDENENKIVHYCIDVLWHYTAKIIIPGTCNKRFKILPQVASLVLVLLHRNASLERLFSVVRKSKTDMRSLLKLDGTLSSVLTTKTYNPESSNLRYKWRPDKDLLDLSKKATITYNNEQTEK